MNTEWKTFLKENGAEFALITNSATDVDIEQLVSFSGNNANQELTVNASFLSVPCQRAMLKITGEDAESFLQNQLTNDIRKIDDTNHQASAWCSPKGRIIANFRIFKQEDTFFLSLVADLAEHVIKKLRMYVMMSKVVIEDVSDEVIHFSFMANDADQHIKSVLAIELNADCSRINHEKLTLLRFNDVLTRYDVFGDVESVKQLWTQLQTVAKPINDDGQIYSNILAGRPEVSIASSEAWIPQMVNYIHVDGVDFKKGCYPGQEVVARLNYLGKTKRRLYRLSIDNDVAPEIGAKISSEKVSDAGRILLAVKNAKNTVDALAVMKISEASQPLHYNNDDGGEHAPVTVLDLPYVVDDE